MKKWVLAALLVLGFLLRGTGADWGFPFLLHPDEPVVANVPYDMAERGSLDPAEYNHPDHFGIYTHAALHHAASRIVFGQPLVETFPAYPQFFYKISRLLVALLGTAAIAAAYLVGSEFCAAAGIAAAALFALFPSYVTHSHYITSDVPLTLFTLLAVLFSLRYLKRPGHGNLAAASACSAVALSVKYPGGLTLLLPAAAVIATHLREKRILLVRLAEAAGVFLLALLAVSPYLVINAGSVVAALRSNAYPVHLGADGLGWGGNMTFYAARYAELAGMVLVAASAAGAWTVVRKRKVLALPLFFGLLYWMVLSTIGLHWERWALPMYTAPLLAAACGAGLWYDEVLQRKRGVRYLLIAASVLVTLHLLLQSTEATARFTLRDTRVASRDFARAAGIREEETLYEGYTPFYPHSLRDGSVRIARGIHDREKTIRHVIVSSGVYDRYLAEPERYPADVNFYRKVFALPLVREFAAKEYFPEGTSPPHLANDVSRRVAFLGDWLLHREALLTGPTIRIYRYAPPGFLDSPPPFALPQK